MGANQAMPKVLDKYSGFGVRVSGLGFCGWVISRRSWEWRWWMVIRFRDSGFRFRDWIDFLMLLISFCSNQRRLRPLRAISA